MSEETIVPATEADFIEVVGKPPERSFFGFAVRRAEKAVAVAGIFFAKDAPVVFSAGGEKVRPRTVLRTAKAVMELAARRGYAHLFALRDPDIKTSDALMRHFNFAPAHVCEAGEVYQWQH